MTPAQAGTPEPKTTWDSRLRCPECKASLGEHMDKDYATYFDVECECGAAYEVEVVAIPEFGFTRKVAS